MDKQAYLRGYIATVVKRAAEAPWAQQAAREWERTMRVNESNIPAVMRDYFERVAPSPSAPKTLPSMAQLEKVHFNNTARAAKAAPASAGQMIGRFVTKPRPRNWAAYRIPTQATKAMPKAKLGKLLSRLLRLRII